MIESRNSGRIVVPTDVVDSFFVAALTAHGCCFRLVVVVVLLVNRHLNIEDCLVLLRDLWPVPRAWNQAMLVLYAVAADDVDDTDAVDDTDDVAAVDCQES